MYTKVKYYLSEYPVIYSISSGLLLSIGWPPSAFTWVLFFAYIPMIHAVSNASSIKKALYYSFPAFFIYGIVTLFWVIKVDTGVLGQAIIFIFGFLLMSLLRSIPFILFAWTYKKFQRPVVWILLPVYYVADEFLQTKWDLSFAWLHLGLGFSQHPAWIQFYELTGMFGGAFLTLLVNILIYNAIIHWKNREVKLKLLMATALIFFSLVIVNVILYRSENKLQNSDNKINVAIVQPNINPYTLADSTILRNQLAVFDMLYQQYINNRKIDLIILPEGFLRGSENSPIVINTLDSNMAIKALKQIAQRHDAAILTGFIGFELYDHRPVSSSAKPTGDGRYYDAFDAAAFIRPNLPSQVYTKNMLVPFMERVPFLDNLSFMEKLHMDLNQTQTSYGRKNEIIIFSYRDMKVAPIICFESTFPDYVREFIIKGANLIAVITDDGWTGHTNGPYQHLYYSSPLAVEFRRNIVRSANTGISATFDENGNQTEKSAYGIPAVIVKEVTLHSENTFYCKHGNLLGWFSVVVSSISLLIICVLKMKS